MRGAVTLVVHGQFYPLRDRPFHQSAWVGGGSAAPAFTAGRATRCPPDRRPLCAGSAHARRPELAASQQAPAASRLLGQRPSIRRPAVGGLVARDCFIAAPAAAATLPLRVRRDVKRKPFLGVEGELDGWAWVIADTSTLRCCSHPGPRRPPSYAHRKTRVLARRLVEVVSTRCPRLARSESRTAFGLRPFAAVNSRAVQVPGVESMRRSPPRRACLGRLITLVRRRTSPSDRSSRFVLRQRSRWRKG